MTLTFVTLRRQALDYDIQTERHLGQKMVIVVDGGHVIYEWYATR